MYNLFSKRRTYIHRQKTRPNDLPDVTLINMNLMLVKSNKGFDQQNYIPLGILYIASYLEREGINVEFADYQTFSEACNFDVELLIDVLKDPGKIVGISCMTNLLPFTIYFCKKYKEVYPDRKLVLGGVGPSPVADEILKSFSFIDAVITGEGEINMLKFVKGNFNCCPSSDYPKNLNDIPLPAYHLLDFAKYDAAPSIITSRGCPFRCTFCTEPYNFGNSGVRLRNIDQVIEEIELLHRLSGHDLFLFQDDILPLNKEHFRDLINGFRKLSFRILWKCFCRVDLITEDLMKDMADNGCVQIRYGIESGSNFILEKIKKGFIIQSAYETVCKSFKYFPSVHASFIWGYPFESPENFRETIRWIDIFEQSGASVLLFELSPLPGSILYKSYRDDLIFDESHYSFFVVTGQEKVMPGKFIHKKKSMTVNEMIKNYPNIFPGFYRYSNSLELEKMNILDNYRLSRRTKIKNEFDI